MLAGYKCARVASTEKSFSKINEFALYTAGLLKNYVEGKDGSMELFLVVSFKSVWLSVIPCRWRCIYFIDKYLFICGNILLSFQKILKESIRVSFPSRIFFYPEKQGLL